MGFRRLFYSRLLSLRSLWLIRFTRVNGLDCAKVEKCYSFFEGTASWLEKRERWVR